MPLAGFAGWAPLGSSSPLRLDRPTLSVDHAPEGEPSRPAALLELRLIKELLRTPEAEVGHGQHVGRSPEGRAKILLGEDAEPSNPDPFGARSKSLSSNAQSWWSLASVASIWVAIFSLDVCA